MLNQQGLLSCSNSGAGEGTFTSRILFGDFRETKTLIRAMIFGQSPSPRALMLSLGTRLAVAL